MYIYDLLYIVLASFIYTEYILYIYVYVYVYHIKLKYTMCIKRI